MEPTTTPETEESTSACEGEASPPEAKPTTSTCAATKRSREDAPIVTIFGAGIAGLTAAHELVERGFVVQVVEPREDLFREGCCDVGGVAATQWSFVPDDEMPFRRIREPLGAATIPRPPSSSFNRLVAAVGLQYPVYFRPSKDTYEGDLTLDHLIYPGPPPPGRPPYDGRIEGLTNDNRLQILSGSIEELKRRVSLAPGKKLRVFVVGHAERSTTEEESRKLSEDRAKAVERLLAGWGVDLTPVGMGSSMPIADDALVEGRSRNNRVELHFGGVHLPGDHGYRFFPRFYRNLDDTMRRTPLYDEAGEETGASALSKLKSSDVTAISLADGQPSIEIPRRRLRSFEEFRKLSAEALKRLRYSSKDIALFQLQLFRFLTMSSRRREEEADAISWRGFVEGRGPGDSPCRQERPCPVCQRPEHHHCLPFSNQFLTDLEKLPQAMAGMRAGESDAHTNGNITVQMILDQLEDGTSVDRLLEGPTTRSWLRHWKHYLRLQGVRFFVGELYALQWVTVGTRKELCPVAKGRRMTTFSATDSKREVVYYDDPLPEPVYPDEVSVRTGMTISAVTGYRKDADFFVSALPVDVFRKKLRDAGPSSEPLEEPLAKIRAFPVAQAFGEFRDFPIRNAPFRDISGIQFFFRNDYSFAKGHTYHQDSAWRLTSVSQLQFWRERRTVANGYLGVLSVDIGEMHAADPSLFQAARQTIERQIVLIRRQLRAAEKSEAPDAPIPAIKRMLDNVTAAIEPARALESAARRLARALTAEGEQTATRPWAKLHGLEGAIRTRLAAILPNMTESFDTAYYRLEAAFPNLSSSDLTALVQAATAVKAAGDPTAGLPTDSMAKVGAQWLALVEAIANIAGALMLPLGVEPAAGIEALKAGIAAIRGVPTMYPAWQSTEEEIARKVWRQIAIGLEEHAIGSIPAPLYYRLDSGIKFGLRTIQGVSGNPDRRPIANTDPYLINAVGGFIDRPSILPETGSGRGSFYDIAYDRWLQAGGVMKSHTRITSMEHANESARHAVRAILHRLVSLPFQGAASIYRGQGIQHGDLPHYWSPEEHELPDLEFLKRVDAILHDEGRPHLVHILGLDEAVSRWMAGRGEEPRRNLTELFSVLNHQFNEDNEPVIDAVEKSLSPMREFLEMIAKMAVRD